MQQSIFINVLSNCFPSELLWPDKKELRHGFPSQLLISDGRCSQHSTKHFCGVKFLSDSVLAQQWRNIFILSSEAHFYTRYRFSPFFPCFKQCI